MPADRRGALSVLQRPPTDLSYRAYLARLTDITIEDAKLLVEMHRLPASAQDLVRNMMSVLTSQQSPADAANKADV